MRPRQGEVLHFSEDPTITRFTPHSRKPAAYVWAVDSARCPDYWFPRDCPRAMAWATPATTTPDRDRIIGAGCGDRVHAIEYGWLSAMRTVRLYAYRLPAAPFTPIGTPVPNAHVSTRTVVPLAPPEPVGDLLALHEKYGIQLRVLNNLWPFLGRGREHDDGVQRHPPGQRPPAPVVIVWLPHGSRPVVLGGVPDAWHDSPPLS